MSATTIPTIRRCLWCDKRIPLHRGSSPVCSEWCFEALGERCDWNADNIPGMRGRSATSDDNGSSEATS